MPPLCTCTIISSTGYATERFCQATGAGQSKSSLHTLLLRGTYIIGWMRLHGFGHGEPQGGVHFGTFKRAWQHGVLYSLRGESHAPDNMGLNVY